MSNFAQTQGSANSTKVTYAKLTSGVPFQCRVVGNVLRRYQYWLKNAAGKSMPFENLGFNRDTEKFDSGEGDPIREAGITELSSYTKKVEPIKSKRAYAIMVINRATNQYECLDLKKDIFDGMISYIFKKAFFRTMMNHHSLKESPFVYHIKCQRRLYIDVFPCFFRC